MVYIYKKIIGEKAYYYLRASERKNKKVVAKDIAYLGSSLDDVKKSLENIPKYSEQIRKAYKTIHNFLESNRYLEKARELKLRKDEYLKDNIYEIEACKIHYNSEYKKQEELTKQEIIKNFVVEFAYNTTSIEGNTIKLEEARNLLQDGITPKNKTLREVYDLQNTEKTFLKLLEVEEEVSDELIINIHKELMNNIDARVGYRTSDVRVIKANFKATPAPYVKIDMKLLIEWYNKNKEILHPLVLGTVFHHKFEKIHPFMDGNGRTGRMIFNYILIKHKYPPLIIHKKTRKEYLDSLRKADNSNLTIIKKEDYQKLINYTNNEMIDTYWNIFL